MRLYPLPPPRVGDNEVEIAFSYRDGTEAEACAIVGDFSVDTRRRIGPRTGELRFGDWTTQGFYHYPGSIVYHLAVDAEPVPGARWELDAGGYDGTTAAAYVNGRRAGPLPWRGALRLDVTPLVVPGQNRIDIEVFGGARNFLGPFRRAEEERMSVDWSAFRRPRGSGAFPYAVVPCGLRGPVSLILRNPGPETES
jgi:hypothetical protein